MKTDPRIEMAPYLERLREIPFVERAELRATHGRREQWDAGLELKVAGRRRELNVEFKRVRRLNRTLVDALQWRHLAGRDGDDGPWILMTPHVPDTLAAILREQGINYIDDAGNCYLAIDRDHVAWIGGKQPPKRPRERDRLGVAGLRVTFALLAKPPTGHVTVREMAAEAGVGKTAAATALGELERRGLVDAATGTIRIRRPEELLDRWLVGYEETLRPKLLIATYRAPTRDPAEIERRVEHAFEGTVDPAARWAWGGAAAAFRLTGHYRGERTALHVDALPRDFATRAQLLPAREADLIVLGAPGRLAFEGAAPRTVHPLLILAELLVGHDERAREAGAEIREKFVRLPG